VIRICPILRPRRAGDGKDEELGIQIMRSGPVLWHVNGPAFDRSCGILHHI
jgi:hypothetical protein